LPGQGQGSCQPSPKPSRSGDAAKRTAIEGMKPSARVQPNWAKMSMTAQITDWNFSGNRPRPQPTPAAEKFRARAVRPVDDHESTARYRVRCGGVGDEASANAALDAAHAATARGVSITDVPAMLTDEPHPLRQAPTQRQSMIIRVI
jgi:hypothetical protein